MLRERESVRVSVLGRPTLLREGLVSLLRAAGFSAHGDGFGQAPYEASRHPAPDLQVLLAEGAADAPALLDRLEMSGGGKTLVVCAADDPALHARAIEMGARGVLDMNQGGEVFLKAVDRVHAGEMWLDRGQMVHVIARLTRRRTEQTPEQLKIESLTPREREIVTLVAEGLTNADIAERLCISEATARNHLTSILDKLEFKNRFQLAVYALRSGLVACPPASPLMQLAAAEGGLRALEHGRTGAARATRVPAKARA